MDEGRLAYRLRTAEAADDGALRAAIAATLAHPDPGSHRESYRGAASRGDILVLEHFDRQAREWEVAGFIECHMRVDDNLSIRDVGTTSAEPQTGVVRYLLDQAFNAFQPLAAQVKIRRDARAWLDIFRAIPGFHLDGEEYRRPHYWTIWLWDRQRAIDDQRPAQPSPAAQQPGRAGPRPPTPPRLAGERVAAGAPQRGPARGGQRPPVPGPGPGPRGPRGQPPRPSGPRPAGGAPSGGPRPAGGPRPNFPRPNAPRPGGPPTAGGPRPVGPRNGAPRPAGLRPSPQRAGGPPRPGGPRPAPPDRPFGQRPPPRPGGPRPMGPRPAGQRPNGPRPGGGPAPNGPRRAPNSPRPAPRAPWPGDAAEQRPGAPELRPAPTDAADGAHPTPADPVDHA